ncbi:MAG: PEP-CTERM sorting domain-containing protein [Phycisphaeraceae bacterium]|nr:PEP-CTERM sorting domain-containing protein [Phycisphaeraceae bacterium]
MRHLSNRVIVPALAALLVLPAAASAETVIFWDFNLPGVGTGTTGTSVPVIDLTGNASIELIGGVSGSTVGNGFVFADSSQPSFPNNKSSDPTPKDDDSAIMANQYPPQGTGDKTAGFEFSFNTMDWTNIVMRFDMLVQSSASRYQQLQYSINGEEFVDFALIDVHEAWGNQDPFYALQTNHWILDYTYDFGSLLDHAVTVDVRLVTQFAPGEDIYITNFGLDNYDTVLGRPGQIRLDMVFFEGDSSPFPFIAGDANTDGFVNDQDLAILQANLGLEGANWLDGDFTGDKRVGLRDAFLHFENYQSSPPMAIPEPASIVILVAGGSLILSRRGRRTESP